jgi:ligand-binding sensor domain-containing protein
MEVFLNLCITMIILSIVILILVAIVIDFYNLTIRTKNKIYIIQGLLLASTTFLWLAYILVRVWI